MNNKLSFISCIFIILFILIFSFNVFAGVPPSVNLHGRLTNSAGAATVGSVSMNFTIYDAYTNGNILWTNTTNVVTDSNGIYNVILNNLDAVPFSAQYYLGIKVGSDAEMSPRINLTSAPYAMRANVSEGLLCSSCQVGIGTITPSSRLEVGKLANTNEVNLSGVLYVNSTSGNVGIGTTTPNAIDASAGKTLHVKDGGTGWGTIKIEGQNPNLRLRTTRTGLQQWTIWGALNTASDFAISESTDGTGVGTTRFTILPGGNVGIGTTSPNAKLEVTGAGTNGLVMNVSNIMYVNSTSGNVGIGTATPSQKLEVVGNFNVTQNISIAGATVFIQGSDMIFRF